MIAISLLFKKFLNIKYKVKGHYSYVYLYPLKNIKDNKISINKMSSEYLQEIVENICQVELYF